MENYCIKTQYVQSVTPIVTLCTLVEERTNLTECTFVKNAKSSTNYQHENLAKLEVMLHELPDDRICTCMSTLWYFGK